MTSQYSSSTDDNDWHSPPSSPSVTTASDEADTDMDRKASLDATTPTATATTAIPHMDLSGEPLRDQDDRTDQRGKPIAQRGARPGSDAPQGPQEQGSSNLITSASGASADPARGGDGTTGGGSSGSQARDRSPSPSPSGTGPQPARRQSQHYYFTSPHTRVGSISSIHSTASSHSPSMSARRRSARPISLASVMSGGGGGGGQGPASPASATASPRTSTFYHHNPHALPQTPTASVSGSRPASLMLSFASPFAALPAALSSPSAASHAAAHWEPQVALSLRQQANVPRPLRLQPSLLRRDLMPGMTAADVYMPAASAAAAAASANEEATQYRAEQAAARMARRRQWQQYLSPEDYAQHIERLEGNEGAFEVVSCFLQRLAHAENDALLTENFPHSRAQQTQQTERMATMRKETVEALLPLLAYGPSVPAAPPSKKSSSAAKPAAAKPAAKPAAAVARPSSSAFSTTGNNNTASLAGPAMPSKAYAPRNDSNGLPPTPPQSPYRYDPRRESGMSSITETSLSGSGSSSTANNNNDEGSTTMWKSVKRASMLFGWASGTSASASSSSAAMPSPAQSTRFTGE